MYHRLLILLISSALFGFVFRHPLEAQNLSTPLTALEIIEDGYCDDENIQIERDLANTINEFRVNTAFTPLKPSLTLCQVAHQHLDDLQARSGEIGDRYLRRDGTSLPTWLANAQYRGYANGYRAEMISSAQLDFEPMNVAESGVNAIQYWINARSDEYDLFSNRDFREIGLAYGTFQDANGGIRHLYVIIFGAQPNVFPIIVADPTSLHIPATVVTERDVTLFIHNETQQTVASATTLGPALTMRVYVALHQQSKDCPQDLNSLYEDWQTYKRQVTFRLENELGLQKIFVQLCDGSRETVTNETSIQYDGSDHGSESTLIPIATITATVDTSATALAETASAIQATQTALAQPPTVDISATALAETASAIQATQTAIAQSITPSPSVNPTETVLPQTLAAQKTIQTVLAGNTLTTEPAPVSTDIPTNTATFTNTATNTPTFTNRGRTRGEL